MNRSGLPCKDLITRLAYGTFSFSGEYLRSWFEAGEFTDLLVTRGLCPQSDTNDRQWAREFGKPSYFSGLFRVEQLIAARRV